MLVYLVGFTVLTWPAITSFGHALLGDEGDGLAGYWGLWWVEKALVELGVHPWFAPAIVAAGLPTSAARAANARVARTQRSLATPFPSHG